MTDPGSAAEGEEPVPVEDSATAVVEERLPARRRFAGVAVGLTAAAAAVSVVLAVALGGGPDLAEQISSADDVVILEVPSPFGPTRVVYSQEVGRALFTADELPHPGAERTYQLWFIDDDGAARSAGTFLPEDGRARVVLEGAAAGDLVVGLTVEPAGGSRRPTGEMLVTQPLA